jgi:hypothetical protein
MKRTIITLLITGGFVRTGRPDDQRSVALLPPLVCHPQALGLEVIIYDPGLDP